MADSVHGGSTQTSGADMQYLQQLCSSGEESKDRVKCEEKFRMLKRI